MDPATAGDDWSRCSHPLWLRLTLSLAVIPFGSLRSQLICNDRTGLWMRDRGRKVVKTAESSGSASNAGHGAEYNAEC